MIRQSGKIQTKEAFDRLLAIMDKERYNGQFRFAVYTLDVLTSYNPWNR
ncbi:MAG: hypothetical protein QHH07_05260 [Sedimentisphaerales bacterium]|nr:hypothetical protein [Sedimentisphaerales bacterium]